MGNLLADKEDGVGKIAAGANFVATGPESGRAAVVQIKSVVHAQSFEDVGGFDDGSAVNYADINGVAFIGDKAAAAAAAVFGIAVAAKGDIVATDKQGIVGNHGVNAGVATPFLRSANEANGAVAEDNGGNGAVNVIVRVEVGFVFVHEQSVEGIGFTRAAGIGGGTEVGAVDTGKGAVTGYVFGQRKNRTIVAAVAGGGGVNDDAGVGEIGGHQTD